MSYTWKLTILLVVILSAGLQAEGQVLNTSYFMRGVPQSNRINPAHQPEGGFYLGLPGVAPVRAEVGSSSLSFGDIIYPHPTEDSLITFLHPLGDKEAFLNKLKGVNYVISDVGTSLFSMGFRTGAGYFSVDLTTRVDGNVYIPGSLAQLALNGAEDEQMFELNGLGADVSGFEELSLGWSGNIGQNIQIGLRGKVLFGLANLTTTRSELSVSTAEDAWNIHSDILLNASLPFAEVVYDSEGMIEDIILNEDFDNLDPLAIARYAFNKRNMGGAIDLGINYRPGKRWLLSASLLDLGIVRWTDNVHQASYQLDYEYTSVDVDPFDLLDDNTDIDNYADSILTSLGDTLLGGLDLRPGETYSSRLNTKLYLGASWYVTPHINFGLLSRTDFLRKAVVEQVTASAGFSAGRYLNFTLSYSYMNSYFKNLGAGLSLNAGPFNLYVISDNALNAVFWPSEAVSANIWVGMNLVFGYKEKMDLPLVY